MEAVFAGSVDGTFLGVDGSCAANIPVTIDPIRTAGILSMDILNESTAKFNDNLLAANLQ